MLSDGLYTVAGTLRKGSFSLGQEWVGQTAEAFDSYMFSWSMVIGLLSRPLPTVGSLINDVEQRGFEVEKDGFWDPALGAARIGMLPAA